MSLDEGTKEADPPLETIARSRVSSVSSSTSSNGTPRRRLAIAPVSVGKAAKAANGSPNKPAQPSDSAHLYMSQLALKEARVSELIEQQKAIQLELQAAEFDLRQFKQRGLKQLTAEQMPASKQGPKQAPKQAPKQLSAATTADLHRGIRESLSRSPSPQRRMREDSQMKRVVGEIGTQFWSFVEDVKTAALGDEEQERGREPRRHREPDPSQYLYN